ncbi:MAG: hypothetical protein FWC57_03030 [Endomicrobia bacterium]|nr:hypothetical protein [Endomicrobiia bacterium]
MNRELIKAAIASLWIFIFLSAAYGDDKVKPGVFCVGDSIVLGNKGAYIYSDILQTLFDKQYGKDKVAVFNYSFFDMNTAQCLTLVTDLLEKQKGTEYVVMMAGEANFYNLNGLTGYLSSIGRYAPESPFVEENDVNAVEKLNTGVASMYNSPAAGAKKAVLQYAFSRAYRAFSENGAKKVGGYTPKVMPSFHVLTDDFKQKVAPASYTTRYRTAWDFINNKRYAQAEEILTDMLAANPLDSNVYYSLSSLYLLDSKGKNADKALKMLEDGILANPFDKNNQCYKGLSVMFMTYDGRAAAEILYFARVMKSYLGERIPEINSIAAIGAADYANKIAIVSGWILSDIKKINEVCEKNGVKLVVAGYPLDAKSNELIKKAFSSGSVIFVDNSSVSAAVAEGASPSGESPPGEAPSDGAPSGGAPADSARIYADTAKNVMDAIIKNRTIGDFK